jgi:hypothetical protein
MIETQNQLDRNERRGSDDPVLMMIGVGKRLWTHESGDSFVERLRAEDPPDPPAQNPPAHASKGLSEQVWQRIAAHQGEQFHTARGLPFTFEMEGTGMWFFREGRRINRKLTRKQLDEAVSRCPLASTTEIKDLIDYPYVFGMLADPRIKREAW